MNHSRALVVALLLPALAACTPPKASTGPSLALGSGTPVATVNGVTVGQDFYNFYVKRVTNGKTPADLTPEQRAEVLDTLIRAELLAQQVVPKEGPDADTTQLLQLVQLQVLQQVASDKKVPKPTDQELREAYEKAITGAPKLEYHARHILVATQPFAQKIVERLDKGEKFEDIAKRESMDASSKDKGGELDWFTAQTADPAIVDAVGPLKKGEYTHTPVQTRYGWHVLLLVETRDAAPPPTFESVRPRLEQFVGQQKLKNYTDDLMRNAKIEKKLEGTDSKAADSKAADSKAASSSSAKK
jgi:peptidyl-prolyl cis-trans isomerase C